MATVPQRIFAASGAIVFFLTSIGLSVVVIITLINDGKQKPANASTDTASCQDTRTEEVLPAPEVYKPQGKVDSLQTTDLKKGSGPAAKKGDCLVVKYYGTLASDGTVFDESFTKPSAFAFKLGGGQVIPGWDQGMAGIQPGGTRRLVIPAALGYGAQGSGSIPANADLVFVVKLLRIQ